MSNPKKNATLRLVFTALFAAITCLLTISVQIPSPTGGYLNLGDVAVLLSSWLLGPLWGTLAAATGSALADVLSGYFHYAPATFLIKGLMALAAWFIMHLFEKQNEKNGFLFFGKLVAFLAAEVLMVVGYFLFEAAILQYGFGAAAGILGNSVQGLAGIIGTIIFSEILSRTKIKEKLIDRK